MAPLFLWAQRFIILKVNSTEGHGMPRSRRDREPEPMTLGQALAAKVRLIVWCKSCGHQAEPDVATQVAHHGSTMPVSDWARFLRCSICSERDVDFVVSGAAR
jgi:hypothetical protein